MCAAVRAVAFYERDRPAAFAAAAAGTVCADERLTPCRARYKASFMAKHSNIIDSDNHKQTGLGNIFLLCTVLIDIMIAMP